MLCKVRINQLSKDGLEIMGKFKDKHFFIAIAAFLRICVSFTISNIFPLITSISMDIQILTRIGTGKFLWNTGTDGKN